MRAPVKSRGLVSCLAVVALATACTGAELTFGGPLNVDLTSNQPVSVTDSLQIDYEVQGSTLLGMVVTWGDAELDSLFFAGAQRASGRVRHLYLAPGTYTVTAQVTDQNQGMLSEELTIRIDP